ncbi:Com family DNA-binding transcriptional regulator [Acinetobacter baumannii]|uniref:Com family DNA-binding transcriptional regulator n=1 Tax=Acinetobacter baumannii TaxID=470 RepID=UPI000A33F08A|nr:Com family DNA-binding transcriptional regulator [Acinetobacter baumannii]EHU2655491.1 Com family DNA-binding transcriptional regulator [Acinetobacter baumannii]EHU3266085.1 Com family DNA-binding transcriptional regulator [Acinetobacter baumannii]MBD0161911.1 Com family DNA-binding transcriptional regulator [Acinetobacter baumannii]RDF36633.1 Com family DNA-binding transcriptional regulator [Acinetobacter baumannii]
MHTIRCRCCYKLLAKIGHFDSLEIKCSRCKSINILSTESALPERLEHPKTGKNNERSIQSPRS